MKTKHILCTLALSCTAFVSCKGKTAEQSKKEGYTITVNTKNATKEYLYLGIINDAGFKLDSIKGENNTFVFKGKIEGAPLEAIIFFKGNNDGIDTGKGFIPSPMLSFILTNDDIIVNGNADELYTATVSDNSLNKEWASLQGPLKELQKKDWEANKKLHALKTDAPDYEEQKRALDEKRSELQEEQLKLTKEFVEKNPNTYYSLKTVMSLASLYSFDELKNAYDKLSAELQVTKKGIQLKEMLEALQATAIGGKAANFTMPTLHGKTISLADYKGKYVLLDFWGSWCVPCRKSHPHLKETYEKYHNKGLEIIAVAMEQGSKDSQKDSWSKAIETDGIDIWHHILNDKDIKGGDIVKTYGITAFPTKILIDKEGKILAKNAGGSEEIDAKLKEIFAANK